MGNNSFSHRLRKLRIQKGLSQNAFSELIELNSVQYNRYENKWIIPATETLGKLADALEVSVDFLLEGLEEDAAIANFADKDLLELFSEVEEIDTKKKLYNKSVVWSGKTQEIWNINELKISIKTSHTTHIFSAENHTSREHD